MTEAELCEQTEDTIRCLYQNREQEGFTQVGALLPVYQKILQELLQKQGEEQALKHLVMLKELVGAYQVKDILGMADCMSEGAFAIIRSYYQN